jgi:hypothetical protein
MSVGSLDMDISLLAALRLAETALHFVETK